MYKKIKTTKGAHGNKLEFWINENLNIEHVIVEDKSAQLSRTYYVGHKHELAFEEIEIVSANQVIKSWSNGESWF